jgi:hypothetical protein
VRFAEDAIKWADNSLQYVIDTTGFGGDRYTLDSALGGLESAFTFKGPLVTENSDGTLKINYQVLSAQDTGATVFDPTAILGRAADKAA